ncbi:hypothetical protein P3X46_004407 [Hevea brasiliensis]|uniref:Uncharacterized protein n=1 Tax=Hevea brasiliensis TaxID=3981 RepID=A0ABQ9N0I7_HEVBR|nr:transcription termination factor MTEF18, mitochondrial [Hevea brasiliensis]KAJ9184705.1 hypothetical protein P3X46_004407 [Hevea brasiliensis]
MTHLHKLRKTPILNWVSLNSADSYNIMLWSGGSLFSIASNPRFYRRKRDVLTENADNLGETLIDGRKISDVTRKKAQAALFEYLHSTRSLQFLDAEHMSRNSPNFLKKLLQKVDTEADIGRSVTRFLRYHPINEFEPFFESSGLRPHEYKHFLQRDLMFLSDDDLLLENYHILCNYGIPRNKIGKVYKEAGELFRYDYGVLAMKLKAYEELGLNQSFMTKMVVYFPSLLIGDVNTDFIKSLQILREGSIEFGWIEEQLSENISYNWSHLHAILYLFSKTGYSYEQLGVLISKHPGILFEGSGDRTLSLVGFLFKFGSSMKQICSLFRQFPQMQVGKFLMNLRQCYLFLTEIEMDIVEIGKIIRSHSLFLGSCTLKKTNSLLTSLNVGKKRLCDIILQNPQEMKNWVLGSKVGPLPKSQERLRSKTLKTKFLLDLGFEENSKEMEKALKVFRGRGAELQERFDCIMRAGLDRKDVCEMIKICPQILNQKKEVIKMKIDCIVNDLGYPISSLVIFPAFLCYTIPTIKLKLAMYNWLKDQGKVDPTLSLSTVIGCSDKIFVKRYVEVHPRGPEVWQELKKKI